jgi:hypothetical protein
VLAHGRGGVAASGNALPLGRHTSRNMQESNMQSYRSNLAYSLLGCAALSFDFRLCADNLAWQVIFTAPTPFRHRWWM